jgi:hypothetical protein
VPEKAAEGIRSGGWAGHPGAVLHPVAAPRQATAMRAADAAAGPDRSWKLISTCTRPLSVMKFDDEEFMIRRVDLNAIVRVGNCL